ncbi:hypothetical protein KIH27_11715 [Mycobacterium sp. M1]|uniref:Nucleotide exchange factor GrpE n=1 Tax=Mycolicibacter acidiphilus TaxID=2835306 RepID=A0ABS5RJ79_9MYCO|nr:hypothetical protein [Mycolicibacter acidiphilus]MBS9534254.1 hypothetical protein [Mycolicibacter acidiphilus]
MARNDERVSEGFSAESDNDVPANATTDDADSTDGENTADGESANGADTFSRTYVEKLRRESAGYRERAQKADELAQRLHVALTAATGKLADPTDLPFDATHLDDPDALAAAVDALLAGKPHLATRRVTGDVGQGNRGNSVDPVNLHAMLRARA